jgi:NAD(P)-dependent dehydrogenase (short-subunit alcohol dehydrogenase family)
MAVAGRTVVITGAAGGLGAALAREARARGAARIVVVDLSPDVSDVAREVGGTSITADLASSDGVLGVLDDITTSYGTPDIYIGNAGVMGQHPLSAGSDAWELAWRLHVMSNVWAAQRLVPLMRERGSGHIASTASSAAVTLNGKSAPYTVTKAAELTFAEWLAAECAPSGIGVSCFCPGGMDTDMLRAMDIGDSYSRETRSEADAPQVAAARFLDGIQRGDVLITTKQRTLDQLSLRGQNHEAWLAAAAVRFHGCA